jgi:hydroxyacylglutathione hydrolase
VGVTVKRIITGRLKENCYIVDDGSSNAVVIDPGGDAGAIIRHVSSRSLRVAAVVNTHGHYDHVGAVEDIKAAFGVPFYMHSRDERLMKNANLYSYFFDSREHIRIPRIDFPLDKVAQLDFGGLHLQIIETPGHTPGGLSLLIGNCLFTGDTLFNNRVGRTDLPGGDISALRRSIQLLSEYPPEAVIFPGHGETSLLRQALRSEGVARHLLQG